jgi:polyribonucleotide nucleotidyltransferase
LKEFNVSKYISTEQVSFKYGTQSITLETGGIAGQTTSAVSVRVGETVVFVPLVALKECNPNADFLPLSVHYQKRDYASGQVPGNYFRREGRPSEAETLISRLIDRPLRALFPKGFYNEVQILPTVLSVDPEVRSDIPAILGASAALALSGLPCRGPLAAARVGYVNGKFVLNPNQEEIAQSDLDLVLAGTEAGIVMVEAEANAVDQEKMLEALMFGHEHIKEAVNEIKALAKKASKPQWDWQTNEVDAQLAQKVNEFVESHIEAIYAVSDKSERKEKRNAVRAQMIETFLDEEAGITAQQLETLFVRCESNWMRNQVLSGKPRLDGRDTRAIRAIDIKMDLLPRVHGSALFTRGETQALVTATLGTERDAQVVDGLDGERRETFMLHYNFPPYCVGEVGQVGSPKRREIGHGNLAKRAMRAVLPSEAECPYVLRVVSEIMSSNGSSSMATVCGTSLALMDAGVSLKAHVAGIAMGLVKEGNRFAILSDISGDEDHIGDMDFKVAGTREGITALQMDIKTDGITREILAAALTQAREGLNHILDKMEAAVSTPREKVSRYAPQIMNMQIPVDKIQALIGKGGATIRAITTETDTLIDIHRESGLIRISSPNAENCQRAIERIKEITEEPAELEIGMTYEGVVVKLIESGAFVSIMPGRKGFIHVSEVNTTHPEQLISEVLKEKQNVTVKVLDIDRQRNRVKLTMKGIRLEDVELEEESTSDKEE